MKRLKTIQMSFPSLSVIIFVGKYLDLSGYQSETTGTFKSLSRLIIVIEPRTRLKRYDKDADKMPLT